MATHMDRSEFEPSDQSIREREFQSGCWSDDNRLPSSRPISPSLTHTFSPDDSDNPRNWSPWHKWRIVLAITLVDLSVSWAASGYSPAEKDMEMIFGVSAEVGTLGLSLYVLGLALGPMTLAPLSEVCAMIMMRKG